jgi:hypothetical protein
MVRPPDAAEAAAIAVWDDLLRAYAEVIEQQRAYLLSLSSVDQVDEASLTAPMFHVPSGVPPMPTSFEPWAMSLLTETAGLTELAHQILSDRPVTPRPPRFASSSSGSTLDQKI